MNMYPLLQITNLVGLEKRMDIMDEKIDIAQLLLPHRGEKHIVVLHAYPDPDAIASAYAHKVISAQFGVDTDIVYSGEISHQQNIALVKLLGLQLVKYEPGQEMGGYQAAVFVDHQGTTVEELVCAMEMASIPVLLVIDHHQPQDRLKPEFLILRETGSTATIYASYLQDGVIALDAARKEHVLLATALVHGIHSDTQGFIRATVDDLQAAAYLSRFKDAELLSHILDQARSKHTMDIINRALGNRENIDNFSIAGIGFVRAEDRDAIPQAADFLLTEENIHTAIVYGIIPDQDKSEALIGSMRTSKFTLDPDQFLKEVFGKNEDGRYYGGGRPLAGGFSVPIGFLSGGPGEDYLRLKWEVYDAQIKHKIFTKIGVDRRSTEG
jgi:nanoRNase/pAp phosphatase (c-di-AMP/oligoRNAs hydrolase)